MRRSHFGLVAAAAVAILSTKDAACSPAADQKAIAVLIEADPWTGSSGQPKFVLYSDGTVIWRGGLDQKNTPYRVLRLKGEELENLRQKLAPSASFMELKRLYDLSPNMTDQPSVEIYLSQDGRERCVSVVGLKPKDYKSAAFTVLPGDRRANSVPGEFRRLYQTMSGFDHPGAPRWKPEYLEVRIWPFDHAKKPPIPWRAGWPDLNDRRTEQRDQMYLLYFPPALEEPLKRFLAERGSTRPALINGRKWSVAYRYALPGMSVWERALLDRRVSK